MNDTDKRTTIDRLTTSLDSETTGGLLERQGGHKVSGKELERL